MGNLADRFEVAAGLAASILDYAANRGIDAAPVARACGLDPARFGDMFGRIGLDRFCRFLEALAVIANDPEFGLKAGAAFEKGATGPFGYALMVAPTPRDAMVFLGRHMRKIADVTRSGFVETAEEIRFSWSFSPLVLHRDQFVDMGAAAIMSHLRAMLGSEWESVRVDLEREKPRNPQVYRDILGRNVNFSAPLNGFALPVALQGRANPNADPRLFALVSKQAEDMRAGPAAEVDPVAAARAILLESLGDAQPSLAETARRLGMSERTLQRRLAAAGTSLHELADDCRREFAERLLAETDLSLAQISYRLGFSAPSAFTRSAIRWFGAAPSGYRRIVSARPA